MKSNGFSFGISPCARYQPSPTLLTVTVLSRINIILPLLKMTIKVIRQTSNTEVRLLPSPTLLHTKIYSVFYETKPTNMTSFKKRQKKRQKMISDEILLSCTCFPTDSARTVQAITNSTVRNIPEFSSDLFFFRGSWQRFSSVYLGQN